MKTLSEAVQIEIIQQLSSTYRNIILSAYKEEHGNMNVLTDNAKKACKGLIVMLEDSYKDMKV